MANCATPPRCRRSMRAEAGNGDTTASSGREGPRRGGMCCGLDAEGRWRRTAGRGPYPGPRRRRENQGVAHRQRDSGNGYEDPERTRGPYGGIAVARPQAAIRPEGTDSRRTAAVMQRGVRSTLSLASVFAHAADAYRRQRKDEHHLQDGDAAKDAWVAPHYRRPVLMGPLVTPPVNCVLKF